MLTQEQKRKKQQIQEVSYKIQDITSRTLQQNVDIYFTDYGETKPEVRKTLRSYTSELEEYISEYSASLFNATELTNFDTVISGSILYDS